MIAVVFPGQGSQKPGMGEDLYNNNSFARQVFDRVESATGLSVSTLCHKTDEETLRQTQNAQLALYTCGLAAWYALSHKCPSLKPTYMAGHSVGEYAALAAAGVLSVEDGARLVKVRGELMASAGAERPGTMAAVLAMDKESLEQTLKEVSTDEGVVVVANDNCPGQLVISGDIDAVQKASVLATERGARKILPLNVSGAFHSPLMEASAKKMGDELRRVTFEDGSVPVVSNVTAKPVDKASDWADLLERQLMSPVLWTGSVQTMLSSGVSMFVECGSGDVLTGLLKRIDKEATGLKVVDTATLDETVTKIEGCGNEA